MQAHTVWFVLAGILLAGCVSPGDDAGGETLYTHHWAYGSGYGGSDALPVFQDSFVVDVPHDLTVTVDWAIEAGRAALEFLPPGGQLVNLTDEATGGPRGSGDAALEGAAGTWGFRIPTWRADDGRFPGGFVEVRVTAP